MLVRSLRMDPGTVQVSVLAGLVTLAGEVDRLSDIAIISRLVNGVEGVVGVDQTVRFRYDDVRATAALARLDDVLSGPSPLPHAGYWSQNGSH